VVRAFILLILAALGVCPQTRIMPLAEVRAGMQASGRTVFNGAVVEQFQAEILGVLENVGPKQSIILARLSGGPLERTGILQGMSGSPVYVDGRLIGAVALSFPFSKEPVAGIRPIEEMLLADSTAPARTALRELAPRGDYLFGEARLTEIATPFWASGFTRAALDHFAPQLRAAGLQPVQGVSGGGRPQSPPAGTRPPLQPGSMISVQLIAGDLAAGADGTVTHVDGDRVYAFGHRFVGTGDTELPFARAEVITLLASQEMSFKISRPKEWLGVISQDRTAAIAGRLGGRAAMLPVEIAVRSRTGVARDWRYRLELARDRLLAPLLLQMAAFSALDATERTAGLASIALKSRLEVEGAPAPLRFENVFAAELGAPQMVAGSLASPAAAILQSGFTGLKLKSVALEMEVVNEKKLLTLDTVWCSRREVRPGEPVEITAVFTGESGAVASRTVSYAVPPGAPPGTLYFTVADGPAMNLTEYRQFLLTPPRGAPQLIEFLNGLHSNMHAWVRVWRAQPSWQIQGENLPAPPPSLMLLLTRGQGQHAVAQAQPGASTLARLKMDGEPGFQFTGSRTVQIEVRE
jgi:hypothetical protein